MHVTLLGTPIGSPVLEEIVGHIQAFFEINITDEGLNYEVLVQRRLSVYFDRWRPSLESLSTVGLALAFPCPF